MQFGHRSNSRPNIDWPWILSFAQFLKRYSYQQTIYILHSYHGISIMSFAPHDVWNQWKFDYLFNNLFRLTAEKQQNSHQCHFVMGFHPWMRASNEEIISMSWRHHGIVHRKGEASRLLIHIVVSFIIQIYRICRIYVYIFDTLINCISKIYRSQCTASPVRYDRCTAVKMRLIFMCPIFSITYGQW